MASLTRSGTAVPMPAVSPSGTQQQGTPGVLQPPAWDNIKVSIDLSNQQTRLSNNAIQTLQERVAQYTQDILTEASYLEEGNREQDDEPDLITNKYITQAANKYRITKRNKPSKSLIAMKIISPVTSLFCGWFFKPQEIGKCDWQLYVFLFLAITAVTSSILLHIMDNRDRG